MASTAQSSCRPTAGWIRPGWPRRSRPAPGLAVPASERARVSSASASRTAGSPASRSSMTAIESVGVSRMINGPEAFTPDNEFILGESAVRGLFVAAGFCAHGIAGAAGIGRELALWIVDGEPELDLWRMDIRRFGPAYASPSYTLARTREVYQTYYDIHYPNEERQAGRPLRLSPTYPRPVALGAEFGEKSGWERA